MAAGKERLDKVLFYMRAVKSRTLAQKLIESGAVRVNSTKTQRTDQPVGPGDVLTFALGTRILVWRVLATGSRRGPATEAQALYEDLSPPPLPRAEAIPPVAPRDAGSGRPTKKERRDTDRFLGEDE